MKISQTEHRPLRRRGDAYYAPYESHQGNLNGSTTPGALPRWVRARLERLLPRGPNGNREGCGRR
jgi:hypothetical protein